MNRAPPHEPLAVEVMQGPAAAYLQAARESYASISKALEAARAKIIEVSGENSRLRDRIEVLEAANGAADYPRFVRIGLTVMEARLFALVMRRGELTCDEIMSALYADRCGDEPDPKILQVYVARIRKKLKPHGIRIYSRYGAGAYWIDEAGWRKAQSLLDEATR